MNNRQSPLYWSFPAGTWFLTQVRISVFFPLVILVLCYKFGLHLGGIFSGILFFSVLCHEFGHVLAARMTGGGGDDILIWPLGGLAFVQPAHNFSSQFLTAAAGPLVNLFLCVVTFPAVYSSIYTNQALNPFVLPSVALEAQLFLDLLVLIFSCNWLLLLLNLIPVFPLDGGRMLQTTLSNYWNPETSIFVYLRIGFVVALVMMVFGLLLEQGNWLLVIGAILVCLNMQESVQVQVGESYDDSFMGYDFSQGYTSLERSAPTRNERRPNFFQRWREKRRRAKARKEREKQLEAEQQLDYLLQKVHNEGIDSLSDAEKRLLNRVSARFRNKGKQFEEF